MDGEFTSAESPVSGKPARSLRRWLTLATLAVVVAVVGGSVFFLGNGDSSAAEWKPPAPLNAKRALESIEKICSFGSRMSGSRGMELQQEFLRAQFTKLGGSVSWQEFAIRHPVTGDTVNLKNMIISYGPATEERLLIVAHYDTRPFPDLDPVDKRGKFLGANDGASGPALMIELAHAFAAQAPKMGVDFVLFDAEEFVFQDRDEYFLGSSHFARSYLMREPTDPNYRAGILVDMIADKHLELYYEQNSFRFAPQLVQQVWKIAAQMKIKEFVPKLGHELRDDHLPLNEIAKIPTIDIIDFDYPSRGRRAMNYWHTTQDTPDKCSGESVCKVAAVLLRWIDIEATQK